MINKVILIGNLGADPELKYTPSGQAVANLRIATSKKWTDKQGQPQERTEWHRVIVWGKSGETAHRYLKKGSQVFIEGELQTRSWDDKDGKKRYSTEVVAQSMKFLGGKRDGFASGASDEGGSFNASSGNTGSGDDAGMPPPFDQEDDIPF